MMRAPRDLPLPLSFAQQRLWLLERISPGTAAYILPYGLRLRGRLDVDAVRRSLRAIVGRHEALRTVFRESAAGPVQIVSSGRRAAPALVDLGGLPAPPRDREARRLTAAELQRPFDLARGPLLRVVLVRLEHDDHLALLAMHHIVSDGWSMGTFVRELVELYSAAGGGGAPPQAPPPRDVPPHCPTCRCSTPTTPPGSANGCRVRP
jgi:hypothetical protein